MPASGAGTDGTAAAAAPGIGNLTDTIAAG
jgi:hypothetical protein